MSSTLEDLGSLRGCARAFPKLKSVDVAAARARDKKIVRCTRDGCDVRVRVKDGLFPARLEIPDTHASSFRKHQSATLGTQACQLDVVLSFNDKDAARKTQGFVG